MLAALFLSILHGNVVFSFRISLFRRCDGVLIQGVVEIVLMSVIYKQRCHMFGLQLFMRICHRMENSQKRANFRNVMGCRVILDIWIASVFGNDRGALIYQSFIIFDKFTFPTEVTRYLRSLLCSHFSSAYFLDSN